MCDRTNTHRLYEIDACTDFGILCCCGRDFGCGGRLYAPIVEWGGAGATVPLTGFGYNLAKGVREAVDKEGLIGVLKGGFTASSAGIATAIAAAVVTALLTNPRDKS